MIPSLSCASPSPVSELRPNDWIASRFQDPPLKGFYEVLRDPIREEENFYWSGTPGQSPIEDACYWDGRQWLNAANLVISVSHWREPLPEPSSLAELSEHS